jgi:hypothetical protein
MSSASRRSLATVVIGVALGACGGGSSSTPTPLPSSTPNPCVQSVDAQAQGPIGAMSVGAVPFTTLAAGRVDVTVDWTLADSQVGVYIVQVAVGCDLEKLSAQACNFLVASPPSSVKPRKVSVPAAAGIYELLIANFSSNQEAVTAQVVLSLGTCPAFAASVPAIGRERSGAAAVSRLRAGLLR